ncbi:twin-arginine translocation signal domain-containing protein, partial [Slackia isoflavoniconvertens]
MAQISRRDFLKGSVATGMLGAVAATGLGCAPAQQTSSEALSETGTVADAAETSSWRVAPES